MKKILVFYLTQIIKKLLMLLIAVIALDYLIVGFLGFSGNDGSDWLNLLISSIFYALSIYLIRHNNLIGHLIATYMSTTNLIFFHEVIPMYFGYFLFKTGPQSMMTNFLNFGILILAVANLLLIFLKYFKPQLFQQNSEKSKSTNTIKRYQLDIILALLILIPLATYWLIWWFVK